jgi:hypothetical protein
MPGVHLTIALFIVLGVFLHGHDSAESKPDDATAGETGKANDRPPARSGLTATLPKPDHTWRSNAANASPTTEHP